MQLDQWNKHKFFYSGSYAGYVEKFFLDRMRDEQAPALFWAGRYATIFEDDVSEQVLACFKPNQELTDSLYDSMESFDADGSGYQTMHDTKKLYEVAMEDCGYIKEEMDEVEAGLEQVQNRPDWEQIFEALYDENKAELLQYMQEELKAWKVSKYFSSGMKAGSIENLILSKLEE